MRGGMRATAEADIRYIALISRVLAARLDVMAGLAGKS